MSNRLKNALYSFGDKFFGRGLSLVLFIYLATLLEPEEFGLVAVARVVVEYLEWLADQGVFISVIQRRRLSKRFLGTAFSMLFILSLALAMVLWLASSAIGTFYDSQVLPTVIIALSISMLLNCFNRIPYAILVREQKFKQLFAVTSTMAISNFVVGVTMAYNGFGVWSLVGQTVSASLMGVVLFPLISKWRPSFRWDRRALKVLYGFAGKIIIDQQLSFLSKKTDELFVSLAFSLATLGLYGLAKRFVMPLIDVLLGALTRVTVSDFSRLQDSPKQLAGALMTYLNWALLFLTFTATLISYSADLIVGTLFDETWISAGPLMAIMVVAVVVMVIPSITHQAFIAIARTELPLKSNLIRLASFAILVSLLTPYGVIGVGMAYIGKEVAGALYDLYYIKNLLTLRLVDFLKLFAKSALFGGALLVTVHWTDQQLIGASVGFVGLLQVGLIGTVAGLALIVLVERRCRLFCRVRLLSYMG